MKKLLTYFILVTSVLSCTKYVEVFVSTDPVAPKVNFNILEDSLSVSKDSIVSFKATITTPAPVECAWYCDNVKVSSTPELIYRFSSIGKVLLTFQAYNASGSVNKKYIVKVFGTPLVVTYSETRDTFSVYESTAMNMSVTVVSGDIETEHRWILDDSTVVSSKSSLSYTFKESQIGVHKLEYRGVNADMETAGRKWTVTVKKQPIVDRMYDDFEGLDKVPSDYAGISGALSVIDNPCTTAVNASKKVLYDNISGSTGSASGYVTITPSATKFPVNKRSEYGTVRLKVWMGTSDYYPYMQTQTTTHKRLPNRINGADLLDSKGNPVATDYFSKFSDAEKSSIAQKVRTMIKTNDWNVLEYDFTTWTGLNYTGLDKVTSFQFRPMSKVDGSNIDAGAASQPSNLRYVYIDDIEILVKN